MNPFNLERARAGEPIQTVEGRERRLIAYLPDRRPHLRVVVLDPKSDKLYSHSESGEHCESVESLKLVMKPVKEPIQEPAATKRSTILPQDMLNTDFLERITALEREVKIVKRVAALEREMRLKDKPAAKVVRWLAIWETPYGIYSSCVLFSTEQNAYDRAVLACNSPRNSNPRAIKVEL